MSKKERRRRIGSRSGDGKGGTERKVDETGHTCADMYTINSTEGISDSSFNFNGNLNNVTKKFQPYRSSTT